jgi:D-alanyl-D-alanine carboxypeptidase
MCNSQIHIKRLVLMFLWMLCICDISYSQDSTRRFSDEELLGKINPSSHSDFSKVNTSMSSRAGIYLRTEVLAAFEKLESAASDEGITITIVSGMRSFNQQKGIWERKWDRPRYMGWNGFEKALDILTYSSMPGSSRHHWGTDMDVNSLENSYFESGEGLKVYEFMKRCGEEFGFFQVYTSKDSGRTGYEEEKWHWSYMPVSSAMLKEYNEFIVVEDINGFNGSGLADSLRILPNYVNGIEN